MDEVISIAGVKCILKKGCIIVKQSHRLDYDDIYTFCLKLKSCVRQKGYKRSAYSWSQEIISHNILYNLGYAEYRTEDTDLDEHEPLHRLVGYAITCFVFDIYRFFNSNKFKPQL